MKIKNLFIIISLFMILLCYVSGISAVSDDIVNDTVSEIDSVDESISAGNDEQVIGLEDSASVAHENDDEQLLEPNRQIHTISDEDSYNQYILPYGLNGSAGDTYNFVSNFNGKTVYIDQDNTTITSASGVVLTNCSFRINSGISGVTINGLTIRNAISSYPIYVGPICSNIYITNNNIRVDYAPSYADWIYGIDFNAYDYDTQATYNFNNINILDNTIRMYGNSYACGIYGSDFINSTVLRNTIYAYSDTGSASKGNNAVYGIALCDDSTWMTTMPRPRNNNILNNTVTVIGQSVYGIEDFGINQNVSDNNITAVANHTGSAYGIALGILDYAVINNNTINITIGDLTQNIAIDMIHGSNAGIRLHSNSTWGYYCNNVVVNDSTIYYNHIMPYYSYEDIENNAGNFNITIAGTNHIVYNNYNPNTSVYPINLQQNRVLKSKSKDILGASDSSFLSESGTIYVDPVNGDDNNTGSDSSPVQTLAKAWDLVNTGGTIFLNEGTYSDSLSLQPFGVVNKSVSFVGASREKTIVTGWIFISITAENYLNFNNFTVKDHFVLQGVSCVIYSTLINMTFEKLNRDDITINNCYANIINCSFNQRTLFFNEGGRKYDVNFISCTFTNCHNMARNDGENNHILFNYCSFINCTDITQVRPSYVGGGYYNKNIAFNNSYFAMNDNPSSITHVDLDNWVVMTFENTTEIHNEYDEGVGFLVSLLKVAHADGTFSDFKHPELLALPSYDVIYTLTNGTKITHTLKNLKDECVLPITGFGPMSATIAGGQTLKITIAHTIILNINKYDTIGYGAEQDLIFISDYPDITGAMTVTINGPNYFKEKILEIYGGRSSITLRGLNAGEYTVNVTYSGDDFHYPASNSTTFLVHHVSSDDITLKIFADNIILGEGRNIFVFVGPNGATGNVTLTIDGNDTTVNLDENGVASFSIKDLSVKNYTINVKYNGDNNFEAASTSAQLSVLPNTIVEDLTEQLNQTKEELTNKTAEIPKIQEQVTKLTQENTKLTIDLKTANQKAAAASNNADAKIKKIKAAKTVKKSKNYVITVTLNKKVKGKFVYVAFNGKTYKAKTNANGIAKITIKKSALKKLAGKKIKYQVISGNSLKNNSVKIKK